MLIVSTTHRWSFLCQDYSGQKNDLAFIIAHFATLIHGMCSTYEACSLASENFMKKMRLMYALLLPVFAFSLSYSAAAQDSTMNDDNARADSLANAYNQQEMAKNEKIKNSENLSDLKTEKRDTKAKAKEAQRVENEANNAARESKTAYRKEKKAQRAREQADKQSKKAAKARTISDKN